MIALSASQCGTTPHALDAHIISFDRDQCGREAYLSANNKTGAGLNDCLSIFVSTQQVLAGPVVRYLAIPIRALVVFEQTRGSTVAKGSDLYFLDDSSPVNHPVHESTLGYLALYRSLLSVC